MAERKSNDYINGINDDVRNVINPTDGSYNLEDEFDDTLDTNNISSNNNTNNIYNNASWNSKNDGKKYVVNKLPSITDPPQHPFVELKHAYISNNDGGSGGGGDLNSLGNSSPDNKNGMDTSRNLLSSSSPYSSYDQKISGEVDSLIDFVNNLSIVARSYNSK